ncbi:MAG: cell wall metabolism sensor histidine kinase WalK [Gammaproteobacteria bacterium]|nr:cell wall metabolism sensor histidine kinase WalK [Gammaproteobacteria bacterium]
MYSKLELRLLNYFLLIAFATVLIGIEFYFELDNEQGRLENLRNKILIMFLVLSIVVAIVLTMFIKNITSPLCKMAVVARHINAGDLTQSVLIDNHDEIGEVGLAINELTNNLHEVAAFTSAMANETMEGLKQLQQLVSSNPEATETIQSLENNLVSMTSFIDTFQLLDTDITNV